MTDETEYMNELEAVVNMRPDKAANVMLYTVAGLFLFLILWASFSKIEIITRGMGQVVPSSETQIIQSLEGGILQELLISEGDRVQKGEILMRISDVAFSSEERGTEAKSLSLQAKKVRLTAEASGKPLNIPDELKERIPQIVANEIKLYDSRQEELKNAQAILDDKISNARASLAETEAEIKGLKENSYLLQKELYITSKMVEQQAVPKIEEIRLQRELSDARGKLEARKEKLEGLQAQLRAAQREREDQDDKFRSKALEELNEVETKIAQLEESLKSIGDRVYRSELRSPVNGVVNKINVKTIGGVIEPAQRLIEIVPVDDQLKISARVRPSDIAFLQKGQNVNVKITAYDPQRYGSLKGELTRIGANSVTDRQGDVFFEVEVQTYKNHLGTIDQPFPITPGMVASVEVITGKRTIMDYMLKPILRARDVALRER